MKTDMDHVEEGKMKLTNTQIFRKTSAAYEVAKIAAILFWLPVVGTFIAYTLFY